MLVLTRKNRESVIIGRPEDLDVMLEITVLDIEGGRVRLGFEADTRMPIHRREVWDRICNGELQPNPTRAAELTVTSTDPPSATAVLQQPNPARASVGSLSR